MGASAGRHQAPLARETFPNGAQLAPGHHTRQRGAAQPRVRCAPARAGGAASLMVARCLHPRRLSSACCSVQCAECGLSCRHRGFEIDLLWTGGFCVGSKYPR
eukprot:scaffold193963_cov25-Tisochrysis_lutea.AAC.1